MDSKNVNLAASFYTFCLQYPELRFWQALRTWVGAERIEVTNNDKVQDTFYFEGKTE